MGMTRSGVPVRPGSVFLDPSGFSWHLPLRALPTLQSQKRWPFSPPSTCCSWITLLIFKIESGGPSPCFPNLKWANSSLSGFLYFLGFSLFLWYLCLSYHLWPSSSFILSQILEVYDSTVLKKNNKRPVTTRYFQPTISIPWPPPPLMKP